MAVTWQIETLERETTNNGVVLVQWAVRDQETVGEITYYGYFTSNSVFSPDHTASGFVAYDDLVEADVITWVKESLGSEQIASIEANVAAQIAEAKTPSKLRGLPW